MSRNRHRSSGSASPVSLRLAPVPSGSILASVPLSVCFFVFLRSDIEDAIRREILLDMILSILACLLTIFLIPKIKVYLQKVGKQGIDLNKPGPRELKMPIPEPLGVVPGVVYILSIIFCQVLFGTSTNKSMLCEYNAALHSIGFMIFLGFADDVIDLPWRYKMVLPSLAALPLLVAYSGGTNIIVPKPLRFIFPISLDLGILYKVYMGLLAVFCTNAINIYAGINGLEAGQSFVIGCSILIHNLIELSGGSGTNHMFSLILIIPFIFTTLGLLQFNWYPSSVFVGDTYTYFAGMTFAVVGVLGHFSKTLLLFFIPQILNFLVSIPQLIGIVHCPRHRLPKLNESTGKLEGVPTHFNLVNLYLRVMGPRDERALCVELMVFQVLCCSFGFFIRYYVASIFY